MSTHPLAVSQTFDGEPVTSMVIFHSVNGTRHCDDGFGAAWAFRNFWLETMPARHIKPEFFPASYSMDPPAISEMVRRAAGRHVYMVDFSLKRHDMLRLGASARSLTVLDHHASAEIGLDGLAAEIKAVCTGMQVHVEFDMARSGAVMTWDFLRGDARPMPDMLAYVQDGDLWQWRLPESRLYQMALRSYPQTFDGWDLVVELPTAMMIDEGRSLKRWFDQQIGYITSQIMMIHVPPLGPIPVVNVPKTFGSEACHEIIMQWDVPVAGYYQDLNGIREWELRSDGTVDVSKIAVLYGGGGHPTASGFRQKIPSAVPVGPNGQTLTLNT